LKRCGLILTLLALLLAGCSGDAPQQVAGNTPAVPEVEVYAVPAAAGAARSPSITTTLSVEREADLLAEEEGRLLEVLADQGQRVKQGQVLARLDDARLRKQLEQDRAEMHSAQARAQLFEVQRQGGEVELQRQSELRKEGLGSLRDYDRARFQLEGLKQEVARAGFDIASAKARVETNELRLSRMQLRAPFDGIVARRYARTGEMLLREARVLRVTELRPLLVRFAVPEAQRSAAREGVMVEVFPVAESAAAARARVLRSGYVVDAASGSVECVAQLQEPVPQTYVPGMAVEVKLPGETAETPAAMWVPAAAVRTLAQGNGEVLLVTGDKLSKRVVTLGREANSGIVVLSGIASGDRVVARYSNALQEGATVRTRPYVAPR
jgi:RND family efflux transporter MFP subunit